MSTMFNNSHKLYNMRVKPDPVTAQNGVGDVGKYSEKAIRLLIKKLKKSGMIAIYI